MIWKADIITFLPEAWPGPLNFGLPGKALLGGGWDLNIVNIRDYALGKRRNADDKPFGGGCGMVLRPDVAARALDAVIRKDTENKAEKREIVYFSPVGARFDGQIARRWAAGPGIIGLCGRYEGVDARFIEARNVTQISLGDFILCGGDVAAMAMVEAAVRLLPGTVGKAESLEKESFEDSLLEGGCYTAPREWENRRVPEVLLSGNHAAIAAWRKDEAEKLTFRTRPDLWKKYCVRRSRREIGSD